MTKVALEEYKALRATIRQRGSSRPWAFLTGFSAWAVVSMGAILTSLPVMTILPLLVLAATFEVVFSLHVSVERIGRYLQVFHEDRWEHTAMSFSAAAVGTDPLFVLPFAMQLVQFRSRAPRGAAAGRTDRPAGRPPAVSAAVADGAAGGGESACSRPRSVSPTSEPGRPPAITPAACPATSRSHRTTPWTRGRQRPVLRRRSARRGCEGSSGSWHRSS